MAVKLNKANAMVLKLRHILDKKTLKSVYYSIFEFHLYYVSLVLDTKLLIQLKGFIWDKVFKNGPSKIC